MFELHLTDRKALAAAVDLVAPAASADLPIHECVFLEITTGNDDVTLRAMCRDITHSLEARISVGGERFAPGAVVVPVAQLRGILTTGRGAISLVHKDGKLEVRSGTYRASLWAPSADDMDHINTKACTKLLALEPAVLADALRAIKPVVGRNDSRPFVEHVGLLVDGFTARFVGTDGHRMVVCTKEVDVLNGPRDGAAAISLRGAHLLGKCLEHTPADDEVCVLAFEGRTCVTGIGSDGVRGWHLRTVGADCEKAFRGVLAAAQRQYADFGSPSEVSAEDALLAIKMMRVANIGRADGVRVSAVGRKMHLFSAHEQMAFMAIPTGRSTVPASWTGSADYFMDALEAAGTAQVEVAFLCRTEGDRVERLVRVNSLGATPHISSVVMGFGTDDMGREPEPWAANTDAEEQLQPTGTSNT